MKTSKTQELSKSNCRIISSKIKTDIFEPALSFKTTIFLCGKDVNDTSSMRSRIAEGLAKGFWYSNSYDIIYPEDIFDELLYGSSSVDLLTLENLLADSVDAVVVIPESAGSIAELGAFANNEKLRNKMICVVEDKYRRDKSFINKGPIKLVKGVNKNAIVYIDDKKLGEPFRNKLNSFSIFTRDTELDKIASALRKMKRNSDKLENKLTLLQLDRFLLPAIYLLEPVSQRVLTDIISFAIDNEQDSINSTSAALTMLTKKNI